MVEDGLLLNEPDRFEDLMESCRRIVGKANR